jgi:DNA-binding response OmpR family regulator
MSSSPEDHILLVEDEKELSDIISEKLSSEGYRIFTATKANEAIEMLNQQKFRCIILDIQLEQGSGQQVVASIRSNARNLNHKTPIIVMSAHLNGILVQEMAKDITCALVKPFEQSELCAKVRGICKAS